MKLTSLLPLVIALPLISCKSDSSVVPDQQAKETKKSQPATTMSTELTITPLTGYFVKNTVKADQPIQSLLIDGLSDWNAMVGIAKTMDNTVTPIDFTKYKVVILFAAPSEKKTEIAIQKAQVQGKSLTINYAISSGDQQSYKSQAQVMFTVPRTVETLKLSQ